MKCALFVLTFNLNIRLSSKINRDEIVISSTSQSLFPVQQPVGKSCLKKSKQTSNIIPQKNI